MRVCRLLEFPDDGIKTVDGFLFHHTNTQPLQTEHIHRLFSFGINYSTKKFSPEEDEVIRANWKKVAAEHNFTNENVLEFSGFRKLSPLDSLNVAKVINSIQLWPKLCNGLPHRSAAQVRNRLKIIFDPVVVAGIRQVNYGRWHLPSREEIFRIVELYKQYEDFERVAEEAQISVLQCRNIYFRYKNELVITRAIMYRVWRKAIRMDKGHKKPLFKRLRKALSKSDTERLRIIRHSIAFHKIDEKILLPHGSSKKAWKELEKMLGLIFAVKLEELQLPKLAWAEAIKELFPRPEVISTNDFCRYLMFLEDSAPEDETIYSLHRSDFDHQELKLRLKENGITGFYHSYDSSESEYLYRIARRFLYSCWKRVLSLLIFKYSIKERIRILREAIERQRDKNYSFEGVDMEFRRLRKFPALQISALVETVILVTLRIDEHWIPPSKFGKYILDSDVLSLLPEKKNNSALIQKSDKEMEASMGCYISDSEESEHSDSEAFAEDEGVGSIDSN